MVHFVFLHKNNNLIDEKSLPWTDSKVNFTESDFTTFFSAITLHYLTVTNLVGLGNLKMRVES